MKTKKRFLSILLSLALVLGMMPGMSLTAYAAEQKVTFTAPGTNNGITVSATKYWSDIKAFAVDDKKNVSISSSNYNITKLVLTDKKSYNPTHWGDSYLGASAGNVSFSGDTMTVTGINAKTVTIQGNSSLYAAISSIDVYYSTHTHSFTYSADGATITATCSNTDGDCTLPESSAGVGDHVATLTIQGSDTGAKFEGDVTAFSPLPAINYYNATGEDVRGEALQSAPTEPGKYWAEFTLGEQTAHVVYEIKAKASIGTNSYATLQQAIDAATDNQTIKLTENVTGTFAFDKSGVTVTLDLNGHTIDGDQKDTVIKISNGTLILDDTSTGKTGVITGGKTTGNGGGVSITSGGTFIMKNGTIEGNYAGNGGGVSYEGGTFTMLGGTIQYNEGSGNTGGVLVTANSFTMSGGIIQYNVGANFGGIGSTQNINISGTAVVKGNVIKNPTTGMITKTESGYELAEGGTPCDVKLTGASLKINVVDQLVRGAKIGVFDIYGENVAFTSGYNTFNNDDSGNKFFFSDDQNKGIHKNNDGELIFGEPITFTPLEEDTKPVINVKRGETTVTSGAPQIGDVLTAETDATDLVYEWYRGNEAISGATNSTYTLTKDDVGKAISVKVYQTKNESGTELTGGDRPVQTSEATTAVTKKVTPAPTADEAKTNSGISYTGEIVTPAEGYEVSSTNEGDGTAITSITDILDGEGTPTIYVRKTAADDDYAPSA